MPHTCVRLYYINSTFGKRPLLTLSGNFNCKAKTMHVTPMQRFPQALALKLPSNVIDINAAEMGRFAPTRERDISGPVINSHFVKDQNYSPIDITIQPDPHVNKYDCHGAVSLSSSMQSNVPSPFSGNHTHLGMPGSQWGQGSKYLSDHLHSSHYLTLRNMYREGNKSSNKAVWTTIRAMSTNTKSTINKESPPPLSSKEKMKKAVTEYGSTVIVFHVSISLLSLGACYLLVAGGVDMLAVFNYLNISDSTISRINASKTSTFVLAYCVHKCLAPFRMGITLAATPFIVRYLRNKGFLKPNLNSNGGGK